MKYRFIKAQRRDFSVERMCCALTVSRSGYYDWLRRSPSRRALANFELGYTIRLIFIESRETYGSPRVTVVLRRRGYGCGENRVARLMRADGLCARRKRRFRATTDSQHHYPVAPNLLLPRVSINGPNQVWVADITYIDTDEGWLYLAVIVDLYSRLVVGWSMQERLAQALVIAAFQQAVAWRQPAAGLIHHSDQGGQYAADNFQKLLWEVKLKSSMSRKGNCYDNAYVEAFFSTLKTELVYRHRFATRQQAQSQIFEYIEGFYNRYRLHSALAYQSPFDFELDFYQQQHNLNLETGDTHDKTMAP